MGWKKCNSTEEYEKIKETALWKGMEFHHFGLILSALFGLIATLMSFYLIWRHCTHYLKPWEQKHIIRVLFMVPIYACVSFLSYYFYRHAVYFEVIRDCYEAFAIASFFSLLCHYIQRDLHSQKNYFRGIVPRNWVLPISWFQKCCGGQRGIWRIPRSGLTWFNVIWFGVFQYCFIRVFMTCVAVITQAAGRYCLESLNPAFAHIWVMVIEGGCVSVAMYCLIQFYLQLKDEIAEHQPLLKVAAIKLVIFLSFWQTLLISFLTSSGAVKASQTIQTPDIKIGIPSMLLCIEMAIFSVFHLWAFPWKVYDIRRSAIVAAESGPGFMPDPKTAYQGGWFGGRALMDAFNPWDVVKAIGRAFKWIAVGRRQRTNDVSYQTSRQGTGLEPTRNAVTAFQKTSAHEPYEAHDDERLLANAQANPTSTPTDTTYPRPMTRAAPRNPALGAGSGDIGTATPYDPYRPTSMKAPYEDASGRLAPTEYGVASTTPGHASLDTQDTSYHSPSSSITATRRVTPTTIPPDEIPLGPPGRKSSDQAEWDMFGGYSRERGEDERSLGGGHGVRDNQF